LSVQILVIPADRFETASSKTEAAIRTTATDALMISNRFRESIPVL